MLCWVLLFTNYSNAQQTTASSVDLTTGNLVNMGSWMGVRYTDTIGVEFCCSGGPNPAMNQDTNTLRFSWGYMAAAQSIALSKVFESIGTGIKVTGYNYSWQINNEGYTSGPLYGNVRLVGANGNVLESYNYDYNRYIPGFETFSGTQKFSVDYGVPSLSSLDVSFTGSDTRFWAGYYGPRVRDVNVSLNYAFDTSKPTAPTTLPTITTNVDTITQSTASTSLLASTEGLPQVVQQAAATGSIVNYDGTIAAPGTQQTQQTQQPQQQAQQQQTQQAVQQPVQQAVQPAVKVAAEPQKETNTKSSGPSALAMSVVSKVQEAVKTVEKEAVAAAAMQAANDVKNADQQTANAMAMISAQTTQAPQQQQSQSIVSLQLPQQQQQQSSLAVMQVRSNEPQVLQTPQVQQSQNDVNIYSLAPVISTRSGTGITMTMQTLQQQDLPTFVVVPPSAPAQFENTQQTLRVQETISVAMTTSVRGNPLNDLIEGRPTLETMVQEQKTEELKRTITTNELETGITLATMAVVPQGYALYGISLADAKFYETKPIYQNQRVVDNVRLLRGLGSDQKHQQMVQDQYR